MEETPLYKCWCKASQREDKEPRYSHNWVVARRGWFRIYTDRVACGSWTIPYSTVTEAILYKTAQWFLPGRVLYLVTENGSYQFGFNPWVSPQDYLNLDMEEKEMRIRYSPFSVSLRILLLVYVVYTLWRYFVK